VQEKKGGARQIYFATLAIAAINHNPTIMEPDTNFCFTDFSLLDSSNAAIFVTLYLKYE
jgi:hypothetical protein